MGKINSDVKTWEENSETQAPQAQRLNFLIRLNPPALANHPTPPLIALDRPPTASQPRPPTLATAPHQPPPTAASLTLMLTLMEVRCSVRPICSAIPMKRWLKIASWMGSHAIAAPTPATPSARGTEPAESAAAADAGAGAGAGTGTEAGARAEAGAGREAGAASSAAAASMRTL